MKATRKGLFNKVAVVLIFSLLVLSLFYIKTIILEPSTARLKEVLFSFLLGLVVAYTNGFRLQNKAITKISQQK